MRAEMHRYPVFLLGKAMPDTYNKRDPRSAINAQRGPLNTEPVEGSMSDKTMGRKSRPGKGSFVSVRADSLLYLAMNDYAEYLASPLWQSIRTRVLNRENRICRLCADPATQVHHRRYDKATMLGDDITRLVALCENCHQLVEFDRGRKCSLEEADQRYDRFEGKEGRILLHRRLAEVVAERDMLRQQLDASRVQTYSDEDIRRAQAFHAARVGQVQVSGGPS